MDYSLFYNYFGEYGVSDGGWFADLRPWSVDGYAGILDITDYPASRNSTGRLINLVRTGHVNRADVESHVQANPHRIEGLSTLPILYQIDDYMMEHGLTVGEITRVMFDVFLDLEAVEQAIDADARRRALREHLDESLAILRSRADVILCSTEPTYGALMALQACAPDHPYAEKEKEKRRQRTLSKKIYCQSFESWLQATQRLQRFKKETTP